jgi:mannose-6-phosphate isomerase-like protein (cupin superfamily)
MTLLGLPVYRGHHVDNLNTLELAPWPERECNAAFLWFQGMEDIHEARVIEVPAAKTSQPSRLALEELVYVVGGRGICNVWAGDRPHKSFEFGPHAIFMIPPNYTYQISNTQGAPLSPALRAELDQRLAPALIGPRALQPDTHALAVAEGERLSLEEIIQHALQDCGPRPV